MGQAKSQIYAAVSALILLGALNGCDDGTVTVTYSYDEKGQKMPQPERATREQCYGISRAQYNDGTAGCDDCAGTAAKDYMPDSWKYVPVGRCSALGGSLYPGNASK